MSDIVATHEGFSIRWQRRFGGGNGAADLPQYYTIIGSDGMVYQTYESIAECTARIDACIADGRMRTGGLGALDPNATVWPPNPPE